MMAAIMGAVMLIDRQTAGLVQAYFLFLYPLPMVFYSAKYGWRDSWMVFAAVVILGAVLSTPASVILTAGEAFLGMLYGSGIRDGIETRKLLLWTILVSVVVNIVTTLIFSEFFGYDLMSEAAEIENMLNATASGMAMEIPSSLNLTDLVLAILTASVVLTGILYALILHFASRILLKRFHISMPPSTPIASYMPPKWSGYAAIAAAACFYYAVMNPMGSDVLKMAMEGIGMCGVFYLIFYGLLAIVIFIQLRTRFSCVHA